MKWKEQMSGYFISAQEAETQHFDLANLKWMSAPRITSAQKQSAGMIFLSSSKEYLLHKHPGTE
ncbi:MAG: hypothetical protein WHV66_07445 [Anaerolineales bacterium]